MNADLQARYRFMREHAGGEVGFHASCALEIARADQLLDVAYDLEVAEIEWADEQGWSYDDLGDTFTADEMAAKFDSNEWTGPYVCSLLVAGEPVGTVGGVVLGQASTRDPYARVLAAEIALDVLDDLRQAVGDARDRAAWEMVRGPIPTGPLSWEQVAAFVIGS